MKRGDRRAHDRWQELARQIQKTSDRLGEYGTAELQARAQECRDTARTSSSDHRLVEVLALTRAIAGQVHGLRHYPEQIFAALALMEGRLIEMQTGEGKTLTSLMAIVWLALRHRQCHVFTANEYLATRDAEFAAPVLQYFGLTTAVLENSTPEAARRICYQADVTYGTEKEFGFDYLRDRLAILAADDARRIHGRTVPIATLQNGLAAAVVDEADCILIDQATTPLVIACPQPPTSDDHTITAWCHETADELWAGTDYQMDNERRTTRLTNRGCRKLRLSRKPKAMSGLTDDMLFERVEQALAARNFFREDHDYLVMEDRLEIIDEGTGRVLPGRKWRDGLHQAIEQRAGLTPGDALGTAARITLQGFLKKYRFLCGMTGTAAETATELRRVYGASVLAVPTHRPCQRRQDPVQIWTTSAQKWAAIAEDVGRILNAGRAVLVGTTSISASECCAAFLAERGIPCQLLHARHDREEAEIISQAGQPGRVTVATNMAGRGTDIKLHPDVQAAGGLHVILSEMNRSARVDRQLAGRAARQGDPGSFRLMLSLDDDLLKIHGDRAVARWQQWVRRFYRDELPARWLGIFRRAQRLHERREEHERSRMLALETERVKSLSRLGLEPTVELLPDA